MGAEKSPLEKIRKEPDKLLWAPKVTYRYPLGVQLSTYWEHLGEDVKKLEEVVEWETAREAGSLEVSVAPSQLPTILQVPTISAPSSDAGAPIQSYGPVSGITYHGSPGPSQMYSPSSPKLISTDGMREIKYDSEGWQILPEDLDENWSFGGAQDLVGQIASIDIELEILVRYVEIRPIITEIKVVVQLVQDYKVQTTSLLCGGLLTTRNELKYSH